MVTSKPGDFTTMAPPPHCALCAEYEGYFSDARFLGLSNQTTLYRSVRVDERAARDVDRAGVRAFQRDHAAIDLFVGYVQISYELMSYRRQICTEPILTELVMS